MKIRSRYVTLTVVGGVVTALAVAVFGLLRARREAGGLALSGAVVTRDFDTTRVTGLSDLEGATELAAPILTEAELLVAATGFLEREDVRAHLGLRPETTFRLIENIEDPQRDGYRVVRIAQSIGGLPVFGGELAFSIRTGIVEAGGAPLAQPTGAISSVFARAATDPDADLTITVTEAKP